MMFTRFVAEVKFLRLYTCADCGRQQQGDTERVAVDQHDVGSVVFTATQIPLNPQCMPVGWVSYSEGIYCSECKP